MLIVGAVLGQSAILLCPIGLLGFIAGLIGLFGLMGSGRTELARIIFGLDEYEAGAISVDGQELSKQNSPQKSIANNIAFVTENRREEGLLLNISIAKMEQRRRAVASSTI